MDTNKKIGLREIKGVETIEDLEALGIGSVYVDISGRGGGLGFYSQDVAAFFGVDAGWLPSKFGAGCNYLGGGLRGSIFASDFGRDYVSKRVAALLDALSAACVRVYENIENDNYMNDEESPDGGTNWEAVGTNSCRNAGVISAY
jgi:hypothetical protein